MRPWERDLALLITLPEGRPVLEAAIVEYVKDPVEYKPVKVVRDFLASLLSTRPDLLLRVGGEDVKMIRHELLMTASTLIPFFGCGKVVIRPDLQLSRRLMETALPVPSKLVYPPFNCVYIDLAELNIQSLSDADEALPKRLYGAYVWRSEKAWEDRSGEYFEASEGEELKYKTPTLRVKFVLEGPVELRNQNHDGTLEPFSYLAMPWLSQDDQLIEDGITGLWSFCQPNCQEMAKESVPWMRLCLGLFLYMSHPDLQKNVVPKMHHNHDRMMRDLRKGVIGDDMRGLINGKAGSVIKVKYGKSGHSGGSGGTGISPLAHWRRGHWHLYWTGPGKTIPRANWLEPILVNPEKIVGETKPKVYEVS